MPKEATEGTRTRRAAGTVKRKKKDPNAPKKALSAYMIFASENRQNVISENPGIAFGQIGKLLGERWRAMSDDEKSPYEVKAKEDKLRYTQEMANYQAQH